MPFLGRGKTELLTGYCLQLDGFSIQVLFSVSFLFFALYRMHRT